MEPIKTSGEPEERKKKYVVMSGDLDYWGRETVNQFASGGDNLVLNVDEDKGTFEIVADYTLKEFEVTAYWNKEDRVRVRARSKKEAIEKACELPSKDWEEHENEIGSMEAEEIAEEEPDDKSEEEEDTRPRESPEEMEKIEG